MTSTDVFVVDADTDTAASEVPCLKTNDDSFTSALPREKNRRSRCEEDIHGDEAVRMELDGSVNDDLSSHEFKYQNPKEEAEQLANLVQNIGSNANDLQEVKPFSYKQPAHTKKRKNFFSKLFTNI
jgi:hypothetical protein